MDIRCFLQITKSMFLEKKQTSYVQKSLFFREKHRMSIAHWTYDVCTYTSLIFQEYHLFAIFLNSKITTIMSGIKNYGTMEEDRPRLKRDSYVGFLRGTRIT